MTVIGLSTASVYPDSVAHGFAYAAEVGYDAVEVMVGLDGLSQDIKRIRRLREYHEIPVCAVHAPTLLITQRVWGNDPWVKLERSAEMAHELEADVVVVHPPFRWQKEYAEGFVEGVARLEKETGLAFAVENMYPWRAPRRRIIDVYQPDWDPRGEDYANVTLDLSHAATARQDSLEMARELGDQLRHIHLADGSGSAKDEHLIPGRGTQPCGEVLEYLKSSGFAGHVVLEINTRKAGNREDRLAELSAGLLFARLHLDQAPPESDLLG